jgi:clan AA aspartic protease
MMNAKITLKNAIDEGNARRGSVTDSEVRQITLNAVVDIGAYTLAINEAVRQELGLKIVGKRWAKLADCPGQNYNVTEPVSVYWKDRGTTCKAVVLSNSNEVLLGTVLLIDMDLMVNPLEQELMGLHENEAMYTLYN